MSAVSRCRQNYHANCEAAVNDHVNVELNLSYAYLGMAMHFEREDMALAGVHKFAEHLSDDHRARADKLMKLQADRGVPASIDQKPSKSEWSTAEEALQDALQWEKEHNTKLLQFHHTADEHKDPHLEDFIEDHFLNQQVELIKRLSDLATNARRAGPQLGEFMFDKECLQEEAHN